MQCGAPRASPCIKMGKFHSWVCLFQMKLLMETPGISDIQNNGRKKQESHERKPGELVSKDWFLHGLVLVWLLLLKPRKNVENMDHSLKNAKQLYNLIHPPSRTGCLAPQHIRNSTLIKVCSGSIKMPHQLGGQQHLHFSINVQSTHLLWQKSGPRMFE